MGTERRRYLLVLVLLLVSSLSFAGCPKGTVTHKVTVAEHSFQAAVQGFQDAEIAEHQQGFVSDAYHVQISQGIVKVANAGKDLDLYLASNSDAVTIKAKLDNIYNLLDSIANDGLVGVKNPTSKAALEVALDGIKAIVDNALVQVAK